MCHEPGQGSGCPPDALSVVACSGRLVWSWLSGPANGVELSCLCPSYVPLNVVQSQLWVGLLSCCSLAAGAAISLENGAFLLLASSAQQQDFRVFVRPEPHSCTTACRTCFPAVPSWHPLLQLDEVPSLIRASAQIVSYLILMPIGIQDDCLRSRRDFCVRECVLTSAGFSSNGTCRWASGVTSRGWHHLVWPTPWMRKHLDIQRKTKQENVLISN